MAGPRVEAVRALVRKGAIVHAQSTYNPRGNGRRRVTKVGKSFYGCYPLDGPLAWRPFRGTLPTRERDVIALGASWARFRIDTPDGVAGHTVTLTLQEEER